MTERLHFHFSLSCIGEGNGTCKMRVLTPTPQAIVGIKQDGKASRGPGRYLVLGKR